MRCATLAEGQGALRAPSVAARGAHYAARPVLPPCAPLRPFALRAFGALRCRAPPIPVPPFINSLLPVAVSNGHRQPAGFNMLRVAVSWCRWRHRPAPVPRSRFAPAFRRGVPAPRSVARGAPAPSRSGLARERAPRAGSRGLRLSGVRAIRAGFFVGWRVVWARCARPPQNSTQGLRILGNPPTHNAPKKITL